MPYRVTRPQSCADHDWSPWYPMRDGSANSWRVCRVCGKREVDPTKQRELT